MSIYLVFLTFWIVIKSPCKKSFVKCSIKNYYREICIKEEETISENLFDKKSFQTYHTAHLSGLIFILKAHTLKNLCQNYFLQLDFEINSESTRPIPKTSIFYQIKNLTNNGM